MPRSGLFLCNCVNIMADFLEIRLVCLQKQSIYFKPAPFYNFLQVPTFTQEPNLK